MPACPPPTITTSSGTRCDIPAKPSANDLVSALPQLGCPRAAPGAACVIKAAWSRRATRRPLFLETAPIRSRTADLLVPDAAGAQPRERRAWTSRSMTYSLPIGSASARRAGFGVHRVRSGVTRSTGEEFICVSPACGGHAGDRRLNDHETTGEFRPVLPGTGQRPAGGDGRWLLGARGSEPWVKPSGKGLTSLKLLNPSLRRQRLGNIRCAAGAGGRSCGTR